MIQPSVSLVSSFPTPPPQPLSAPEEIRAAVPRYVAKILASLRAGEIVLPKDAGWGKLEMGGALSVSDLADPRARAAVARMALELARSEVKTGDSQPISSSLPRSKTPSPPSSKPTSPRKSRWPSTDRPITDHKLPARNTLTTGTNARTQPSPTRADHHHSGSARLGSIPSRSAIPASKPDHHHHHHRVLHPPDLTITSTTSNPSPPQSRPATRASSPTSKRNSLLVPQPQNASGDHSPLAPGSQLPSPYLDPLPFPGLGNSTSLRPQPSSQLKASSPHPTSVRYSRPPTPKHVSRPVSPKRVALPPSPTRQSRPPSPHPPTHRETALYPSRDRASVLASLAKRLALETPLTTIDAPSKPSLRRRSTDNLTRPRLSTELSAPNEPQAVVKKPTPPKPLSTPSTGLTPMIISLPYIILHIRNKPVRFLCDTGSMLNLMSPSVRERLDLDMRLAPGTVMGVTGASTCEGVCEGEDGKGVEMESLQHKSTCRARFVVGPTGQSDCILGMPFFVENRAEIRYVHGKGTLMTFQAQRHHSTSSSDRKKPSTAHRVTLVATEEVQVRRGYEWPAQASQAHLSASAIVHDPRMYSTVNHLTTYPAPVNRSRSYSISLRPTELHHNHPTYYRSETPIIERTSTPLINQSSMKRTSWKSFTQLGARTFTPNRY